MTKKTHLLNEDIAKIQKLAGLNEGQNLTPNQHLLELEKLLTVVLDLYDNDLVLFNDTTEMEMSHVLTSLSYEIDEQGIRG